MTLSEFREMLADLTVPAVVVVLAAARTAEGAAAYALREGVE